MSYANQVLGRNLSEPAMPRTCRQGTAGQPILFRGHGGLSMGAPIVPWIGASFNSF